jgi:pyruvate dehydrogenase E1 component alpha subunit
MDVLEVYDEISRTVAAARARRGPSFLEIKTYRYKGHSMSDPAQYRTREELESYKQQDPILSLKTRMLEKNTITEEGYAELDRECRSACEEAVRFSEESPEPSPEELITDVYA